jgi:hypothetical protein
MTYYRGIRDRMRFDEIPATSIPLASHLACDNAIVVGLVSIGP